MSLRCYKTIFLTLACWLLLCNSEVAFAISATQAYLSIPELQTLVFSAWAPEVKKYKHIIKDALEHERVLDETHHVFYHAQNNSFYVFQDFVKAWYQFLYPEINVDNFEFLRPWYDLPLTVEAQDFIDAYEKGIPKDWNDNNSFMVKHMLSVNFSFFGSTKNFGNFGECTFKYFFKNKSIKSPAVESLFKQMFDHFDFEKKYIDQLLKLSEYLNTAEGTLFQIFVPKDKVDQIAFAGQRLGTPYRKCVVPDIFSHKKQRHIALTPILDVYRTNPTSIIDVLDRLQGRLLFSQDVLLNPESGVQIFRYSTIESNKHEDYRREFIAIVEKVFMKWLKKIAEKKITVMKPITSTMIEELTYHYEIT